MYFVSSTYWPFIRRRMSWLTIAQTQQQVFLQRLVVLDQRGD
jgi:hypothetical protein